MTGPEKRFDIFLEVTHINEEDVFVRLQHHLPHPHNSEGHGVQCGLGDFIDHSKKTLVSEMEVLE